MTRKRTFSIMALVIIALITTVGIVTLLSNPGSKANIDVNTSNSSNPNTPSGSNSNSDSTNSVLHPDYNLPITPPTDAQNSTSTPTPTTTAKPTTTPAPTTNPTQTPTPSPSPVPTATPAPTPIPTPSPLPSPNPGTLIFSDSFQSGNMSAWTSTDCSGVSLDVKDSMLECSTTTPTHENWGYLYTWLNQTYQTLDWRWYVYFGNLPTTDGNVIGAGGIYNSAIEGNFTPANTVCSLNVVRQNGVCVWSMNYVNNMAVYSLNSTSTVQAETWYLVELKAVQGNGNGEVHLYLNDAETLNATGLTNNQNNGIDHVSIGGGITADRPITWYCAGAIAATGYVGPEQPPTTDAPIATVQAAMGLFGPGSYVANALTPLILCLSVTTPFLALKFFLTSRSKPKKQNFC